jgi:pimeloyl-ACP methyl ester carboxylesterase
MPHKNSQSRPSPSAHHAAAPPTVSARWLVIAASTAIAVAAVCAWGTLCLLFWQGSWQLLYHPTSAVTRTPASLGLAFDPVGFATTEAGEPRLRGWWIPAATDAPYSRYIVLCLHGQDGNLSNTVDDLAELHAVGMNLLAFDYRGYGQSQFAHPSEAHWREDAEWALEYLTATRHIAAGSIILDGKDLGANLALEVAAQHPELAGVILSDPVDAPMNPIFSDPRAHLVPAHLLVRDRFDANRSAASLRIPSAWFYRARASDPALKKTEEAYQLVNACKEQVWFADLPAARKDYNVVLTRWLDDLQR